MGYNPDNPCPICKSEFSNNYEGYIWVCRGCGNNFDNQTQEWKWKKPFITLDNVLQFIKQIKPNECGCINKANLILKLREHFNV